MLLHVIFYSFSFSTKFRDNFLIFYFFVSVNICSQMKKKTSTELLYVLLKSRVSSFSVKISFHSVSILSSYFILSFSFFLSSFLPSFIIRFFFPFLFFSFFLLLCLSFLSSNHPSYRPDTLRPSFLITHFLHAIYLK